MFPQTSLILGSSLLWSVAPLAARSAFSGRVAVLNVPTDTAAAVVSEVYNLVEGQRQLVRKSRVEEAQEIFSGLRLMLAAGDKRVMILPELVNPMPRLMGTYSIPSEDRLLQIASSHADIADEAQKAHDNAREQDRWHPGDP